MKGLIGTGLCLLVVACSPTNTAGTPPTGSPAASSERLGGNCPRFEVVVYDRTGEVVAEPRVLIGSPTITGTEQRSGSVVVALQEEPTCRHVGVGVYDPLAGTTDQVLVLHEPVDILVGCELDADVWLLAWTDDEVEASTRIERWGDGEPGILLEGPGRARQVSCSPTEDLGVVDLWSGDETVGGESLVIRRQEVAHREPTGGFGHAGFTDGGTTFAFDAPGSGGGVTLFDTTEETRRPIDPPRESVGVEAWAPHGWSPDGRWAILRGFASADDSGETSCLFAWDTEAETLTSYADFSEGDPWEQDGPRQVLGWSPDGREFVTGVSGCGEMGASSSVAIATLTGEVETLVERCCAVTAEWSGDHIVVVYEVSA